MSKKINKYLRMKKVEKLKGYLDLMEHLYVINKMVLSNNIPIIHGNSKTKTQKIIINEILEFLNKESEKIWIETDPEGSDKLKQVKNRVDSTIREIIPETEIDISGVPLTSRN